MSPQRAIALSHHFIDKVLERPAWERTNEYWLGRSMCRLEPNRRVWFPMMGSFSEVIAFMIMHAAELPWCRLTSYTSLEVFHDGDRFYLRRRGS